MSGVDPNGSGGCVSMRCARETTTPGLEVAHYPQITGACLSVPEDYTCFTMIDSVEGDVELISRGVRAPCQPGALTVGQPGEAWILRARSQMRSAIRVVRLYNDLSEKLREDIGVHVRGSPFRRGPQHIPGLEGQFALLYDAIDRGELLQTHALLLTFLTTLASGPCRTSTSTRTPNGQAARLAGEFLRARFAGVVSLDDLASVAGTDKFTLLRAFTRELGITPHAYQMRLRMARARELIAQGMPLADVALAVGYSEQSALNRAFKGVVGITPGTYARAVR
jgi:AraC-like DNA-binding protein